MDRISIVIATTLISGCVSSQIGGRTNAAPRDVAEVCTNQCQNLEMEFQSVVITSDGVHCGCSVRNVTQSPAAPIDQTQNSGNASAK
jgi:hypothetical protein